MGLNLSLGVRFSWNGGDVGGDVIQSRSVYIREIEQMISIIAKILEKLLRLGIN